MQRILVIGNSGAGKSTVSAAIAQRLKLPIIHLDRYRWLSASDKLSDNEFEEKLVRLMTKPTWVMDGNYRKSLPTRLHRADTIVWLDLSTAVCFWRAIKRHVRDWVRGRDLYTDGRRLLPLWPNALNFLWWVAWKFPRVSRPKIEKTLNQLQSNQQLIRLKSQRAVDDFLAVLVPRDRT